MKKIALYVATSPLLLALAVFQVAIFPTLLFMLPLWALLDLIDVLKGRRSSLLPMLASFATVPLQMAFALLGETKPRWLERL